MNNAHDLSQKSKLSLLLLLIWQLLKLAVIVLGGIAVIAGVVASAGIPIVLIGLGALLVFPAVSAERKRAFVVAWW